MFAAKRFNLDTFVHRPHSVVLTREGFQVEWPKEEEKIPHIVLNPNQHQQTKNSQVLSGKIKAICDYIFYLEDQIEQLREEISILKSKTPPTL